jgi:peptide deformylase
MILPIVAYGSPILKKKGEEIAPDYPQLKELIANMYETMYNAHGVGLAAPQIGLGIRLFIVDSGTINDEEPDQKPMKKVFINPVITEETGDEWLFNEGCLSIPDVREDVERKSKIKIEYFDENFKKYIEEYEGIPARIIQHEYDHVEGVLFTDHLSGMRRTMIKKRLDKITKGQIRIDYRMKFPKKTGNRR